MYQEAGYGENWQPAANNARRIDPYIRPHVVLGSLFAIGLVFIIIIVLSLIPVYISHSPTGTTTTTVTNGSFQVLNISVSNYNLQFQSPFDSFNPQTILSQTSNRQTLQAALTSLLQTDSTFTGSVVEINTSGIQSHRKRRQKSNLSTLTLNLNVICNKSCSSQLCLNQSQSRLAQVLSDPTKTPSFRYQQSNSSQIYWLYCQLPKTIQTGVTLVFVDVETIASLFKSLMFIDTTQNQQPSITATTPLIG